MSKIKNFQPKIDGIIIKTNSIIFIKNYRINSEK